MKNWKRTLENVLYIVSVLIVIGAVGFFFYQNIQLEDSLEDRERVIAALEADLAAARNDASANRAAAEAMDEALDELQTQLNEAEIKLIASQSRVEEAEKRITAANEALKEILAMIQGQQE